MKSTDIALVILLAAVSVVVSYWLGNMILGDPNDDTYKILHVDGISSEVESPDIETFNPKSLNPTVEVIIGKCKVGEVYDTNARKCVTDSKNKHNGEDEKSEEDQDSSEPEISEPDDSEV